MPLLFLIKLDTRWEKGRRQTAMFLIRLLIKIYVKTFVVGTENVSLSLPFVLEFQKNVHLNFKSL